MRKTLNRSVIVALVMVMSLPSAPSMGAPASSTPTVATRDGCANQWMFNGVWRVRVTGFAAHIDSITNRQTGWDATEEWRNGTDQTLSPTTDSFTLSQQIVLQKGDAIAAWDSTVGTLSQQKVDYHQFPPSAQFTQVQTFVSQTVDPNDKPVAVIIAFDVATLQKNPGHPAFSTTPPNYRIKLDCSPAEIAHAAAQGGSVEVQAHEGCMNQWLSNGLWRVRVTKLAPSTDSSTNQPNGWVVTQDWVNLTGRSIIPNTTAMLDQQLAFPNGETVSSSNATVTTLNFQQLGYHEFAPGGTFTFTQRFWPGATYDTSIKPVKLLMMFDAKAEAKNSDLPQFHNGSSNIRVKLDCTQ
jgi:hypothetical protein